MAAWIASPSSTSRGLVAPRANPFAIAALISGFTLRRYLGPLDEGILMQAATRMSHGQWPWRDFGWAYGPGGSALRGKDLWLVATTGGPESSYHPQSYNRYFFDAFMPPYEQTAALCGMRFLPPLVLHGARRATEEAIAQHVDVFRERLRAFFLRIRSRRGHQIAAVAVARKLAALCWHLLTKGADYQWARPARSQPDERAPRSSYRLPTRWSG